jgi:DNA repair exonuclease SbcCD ATPase subunit
MRITELEISGFRGYCERQTIELDSQITLLVGENGRGKSSTLNAIEWCLFGSEVGTKKVISERNGWEPKSRLLSSDSEAFVRIRLNDDGSVYQVTRRISGKDPIEICHGSGEALSDSDANSFIKDRIPDWGTFRRAHCFHQELARGRLIIQGTAESSEMFSRLLGLAEDQEIKNAIQKATKGGILNKISAEMNRVAETCKALVDTNKIERIEGKLGETPQHDSLEKHMDGMLQRAQHLAQQLAIEDVPNAIRDRGEFRDWAERWPAIARAASDELDRLNSLKAEWRGLDESITTYNSCDSDEAELHKELSESVKNSGDVTARESRLEKLEDTLNRLNDRIKETVRQFKLLSDALVFLEDENETCPICETVIPDLLTQVGQKVGSLQTSQTQQFTLEKGEISSNIDDAEKDLKKLTVLQKDLNDKADEKAKCESKMHEVLESDLSGSQLVGLARTRREQLGKEIKRLRALDDQRDASLTDHRNDRDRLRMLSRWEYLRQVIDRGVDLNSLESWHALNAKADEAAGLAADMEYLNRKAMRAYKKISEKRIDSVNARINEYYAKIMDESVKRIKVHIHETQKTMSFQIVFEEDGQSALPVLNQAAWNAISLAVLFAQAEAEAASGGLQLVILDDPTQSLDEQRQVGLANAIDVISKKCGVILACTPNALSKRIPKFVSSTLAQITLNPFSDSSGVKLKQEAQT